MQTQSNSHNLSRLKIDNIKPKWVTCIWLLFFLIMGVLFLLTLAVPDSVFQYRVLNSCPHDINYNNKYCEMQFRLDPSNNATFNPFFPIFVTRKSEMNQFFTVDIVPDLQRGVLSGNSRLDMRLEFVLEVYELADNERDLGERLYRGPQHNITITCVRYNGEEICNDRTILYVNQINHKNYIMVIEVLNADQLKNELRGFDAFVTTIAEDYTEFLLALRYTCLGLSLIVAIYYWFQLRKMRGEKLVFEQKYIRVLGFLLILFNDPIYASTILHPTLASAVFSCMFIITFVCGLLLFWIAAFQRVYRESTQVKSKALSWPKLVYIFFLWLFSVVAYCILARQFLKDPSFDFNDEYEKSFMAFKILMIILLAIGLAWMFYGFAQILKKYNGLIWRHKIFFSFSCYFIFCYFVFMFTGTLNVYNFNGSKVILLFGITNLYVWFLQIMYSPSGKGFEGSDQPISLAREIQGYEMLDEQSENRYGDDEEVHNPDQILFQFDNSGNVYPKTVQQQGGYDGGYNQNVQVQSNFDNFGQFGANVNNNNHNQYAQHAQVEVNNDGPQEIKYPYEENNDDM